MPKSGVRGQRAQGPGDVDAVGSPRRRGVGEVAGVVGDPVVDDGRPAQGGHGAATEAAAGDRAAGPTRDRHRAGDAPAPRSGTPPRPRRSRTDTLTGRHVMRRRARAPLATARRRGSRRPELRTPTIRRVPQPGTLAVPCASGERRTGQLKTWRRSRRCASGPAPRRRSRRGLPNLRRGGIDGHRGPSVDRVWCDRDLGPMVPKRGRTFGVVAVGPSTSETVSQLVLASGHARPHRQSSPPSTGPATA